MTAEGRAKLKNDKYEVTALEVTVYNIGTPQQELHTVFKVFDTETQAPCEWETIRSELVSRKKALEQEREAVLNAARLSVLTLTNAIQRSGDWKVKRLSDYTFSISGHGLGVVDGGLTEGTWTYCQTSKQAFPADVQSQALQKMIYGEF